MPAPHGEDVAMLLFVPLVAVYLASTQLAPPKAGRFRRPPGNAGKLSSRQLGNVSQGHPLRSDRVPHVFV